MNSIKILIVEDVVLTAIDLRNTLEKNGYKITGIARTLSEATESVINIPPDLAIIDIVLENSEGDGIQTAKRLSYLHAMPIIYLTANSELDQFREAQRTHPAAYLLKPFNASELIFNVELAFHNYQSANKQASLLNHVMLPTKGGLEMIILDDVMFLKAGGVYAEVVMASGLRHLVSTGLGHLEYYFNKHNFFRLSRSYVINLNYIKRLIDNELVLSDDLTRISIPDINRKDLLNRLNVVRTKPMQR